MLASDELQPSVNTVKASSEPPLYIKVMADEAKSAVNLWAALEQHSSSRDNGSPTWWLVQSEGWSTLSISTAWY